MKSRITFRHWLPILTICPFNGLPDLIYVSVMSDHFADLYLVRRIVRETLSCERMTMEDAARRVSAALLIADIKHDAITVRLMFNRHEVILLC